MGSNTIFLTQGNSLRLFADVQRALSVRGESGRAGFYVADSTHYAGYIASHPEFESSADVLREWEILHQARQTLPDRTRIAELEQRYGETLWNAIVADRRLYMGPNAVREQNYVTRYSHEELLSILITASDAMERLFDRVRPNLVVGFICVTLGEYLAHLIARHRDITFVDLRPTRIRNYFYGGEDVFEPSAALEHLYTRFRTTGVPESPLATAREILRAVRQSHAMYEGVIPASNHDAAIGGFNKNANSSAVIQASLVGRIRRLASDTLRGDKGARSADNHRANRLAAHWYGRVKKPWRIKMTRQVLGDQYVRDFAELAKSGYAFFPLHKEPEVTLLVYGRPWLNQIEAVRNIARCLPAGMTLVVKEHPAAIGYRPLSYYRKLLAIPNVRLAPPEMTSRDVLRHAKLATIVGGSVGLEALMLGVPVVALGNVPFAFLPDTLIRVATNPHTLDRTIQELLMQHDHNEEVLESYVAAVVVSSVPVDFYSVLLGRRGTYRPDGSSDEYETQIDRLSNYIISRTRTPAVGDLIEVNMVG